MTELTKLFSAVSKKIRYMTEKKTKLFVTITREPC